MKQKGSNPKRTAKQRVKRGLLVLVVSLFVSRWHDRRRLEPASKLDRPILLFVGKYGLEDKDKDEIESNEKRWMSVWKINCVADTVRYSRLPFHEIRLCRISVMDPGLKSDLSQANGKCATPST